MDNQESKKIEIVLDNKCPSCGANLKFNPKKQAWICEYCKTSFTLEELQKHNNASNKENNEDFSSTDKIEQVTYDVYKCKSCGAEIITDENTTATFCVYCRNTSIIKSRLSNEFKPDLIIPFKNTKEDAIKAFKDIVKTKKFAPDDFNDERNIDAIKGIYIPFWLYDVSFEGHMNCKGTKVQTWTTGNYDYTKTDIYDVKRNATMIYSKVPVDGSSKFANDVMNSIEPFNYNELKDYNHAYLSGFLAEKYDLTSDKTFSDAEKRIENTTYKTLYDDIHGYTTKIVSSTEFSANDVKKNYVLLPVWMLNVKYQNKIYTFAMNGQTGKFIGNVPIDNKKSFLYFLKIFLIIFLSIVIICYIIFLIGEYL